MCDLFHEFDTTIAGCAGDNLAFCDSKKPDILIEKLMKQQKFVSPALQIIK